MKRLVEKIKMNVAQRAEYRRMLAALTAIAGVFVLVTVYMLILPALAMDDGTHCGMEYHEHSDKCYTRTLDCGKGEHKHSDACYDETGSLICGLEEHAHSDACYEEKLTCGKERHVHTDACYEKDEPEELVDTAEMVRDGHSYAEDSDDAKEEKADADAGDKEKADTESGNDSKEDNKAQEDTQAAEADVTGAEDIAEVEETPSMNLKSYLTDNTGMWLYKASDKDDSVWREFTKKTKVKDKELVCLHLAFNLKKGSIKDDIYETVYEIPENINLTDTNADWLNDDAHGMNQLIIGTDTPDESSKSKEYLAGDYMIVHNSETDRWEMLVSWDPYMVAQNQKKAMDAWADMYITGKALSLTTDGKFKVVFAKKSGDRKEISTSYAGIEYTEGAAAEFLAQEEESEDGAKADEPDETADEAPEEATTEDVEEATTEEEVAEEQATEEEVTQGEATEEETTVEKADEEEATEEDQDHEIYTSDIADTTETTEEITGDDTDIDETVDGQDEDTDKPEEAADGQTDAGDNPEEATTEAQIFFTEDKSEEATTESQTDTGDNPEEATTETQIFTGDNPEEATTEAAEASTEAAPTEGQATGGTLSYDGGDYTVSVTYGPEAGLPEGVKLDVREIKGDSDNKAEAKEYSEYFDQASEAIKNENDAKVESARFFDITFMDGQNQIEPSGPVSVKIEYKQAETIAENQEVAAVHLPDKADNEVIKDVEIQKTGDAVKEVEFTAESFSVYGLVSYTVDYYINGYEFHMPGSGTIKLSELFRQLKIEEDVHNVEKVDFTDNTLLTITPDWHLGFLGSYDWTIRSLKPFTTWEKLTITMKDGKVYEIDVTDAQISKEVITASGETYSITVTYDDSAEIPEGAELKVEEILPENEKYNEYLQQAVSKASGEEIDADTLKDQYARFFDIEIIAEGQKIEPKAEVTVDIKLLDAPEEVGLTPKVVHFAEKGPEVMETTLSKENSQETGLSFQTEEFSVYSVVYTVDFEFDINGKTYAFSIEGGDSTSFKEILDKFHILDKDKAEEFIGNIKKVEFTRPDYLWNGKLEEDAFAGDLKEKNHLDVTYASNMEQGNIDAMNNHHYSAPDWVMIALKPFTSEETLTITMKNGEVFKIKVTDAQSGAVHNSDGTVQTITNPAGTTIDLFNYYVDSSTKTTAGRDQWPGHIHDDNDKYKFNWYNLDGTYADSWDNGWSKHDDNWRKTHLLGYGNNLGINKDHVFKFSPANAGTVMDGNKGVKTDDGQYGVNSWTKNADPRQPIVQGTLSGGYPILTNNGNLGTDGSSLAYLFDDSRVTGKDRYGDVDQLLYVDSDGYYTYDSREYKAYYQNDNTFKLYDQPETDDTELKGFWPFGDQVFWVGMHLNTQFSMPTDGRILNPKNEYKDMQFEFSGDDDTWLYIDGVLVGDGGGIHNRTEIDVNFSTGKVTVTGKKDTVHTGSFEETKYLDDIFKAAGRYKDADWEDIGDGSGHKRFKAGTYHTFDMFYLERGGGESNLYIHYNLVSTADFTGHKSYDGFEDGERLERDQFQFELIGLDGQYQSVYDDRAGTATVTKLNDDGHAIMPVNGREEGAGTVADPKKVYSEHAWKTSDGNDAGGYIYTTGVTEDGNINFGTAEINQTEMHNCDEGHPSLYRYIIREIVPADAVNSAGIRWSDANEEQKAAGGFIKDQVRYDGTVYYMTARVTSWDQTGPDGNTYKAYSLSKTYYTDDTFSEEKEDVEFVSFRNQYAPDDGEVEFTKVDGKNNLLPGAEFTLYTDEACTKIAKDLDGTTQVITSGEDGKVVFDNMAAPRTYYMKETGHPSGYENNNTVYKVIIEKSKDSSRHSRIVDNEDEAENEINKIVNVKPGELSVIKEWQDEDGKVVSGGSKEARVKIQRRHYTNSGGSGSHKVHFRISIANRSDLVYDYYKDVNGDTVTVDWWDTNQTISEFTVKKADWNWSSLDYQRQDYWDDVNHKNRKCIIPNVNGNIDINVVYPNDKDWLFNSDHTKWMKNVSVVGSSNPVLSEDTTFNNSTDSGRFAGLSSQNNWSKVWTTGGTKSNYYGYDFPASDGTLPYEYYVIEVDADGHALTIDQDTGNGYKLKGYTSTAGGVKIINEITEPDSISITIRKTYDAENSSNYLAGAVFKLEHRNSSGGSWSNVSNEVVTELDGESKFTVPEEGISLTGLVDGQYKIHEVSAPKGYVITASDPVIFTVAGGTITSTEGTIENVRYTAATDSQNAIFDIPNQPGAELPSTGGIGTDLFRIAGIMLITFAMMIYGIKAVRRKRRLS